MVQHRTSTTATKRKSARKTRRIGAEDARALRREVDRLKRALAASQSKLKRAQAETAAALDRQTATARILSVISGSPTDLTPVFRTILENATRLSGSEFATLWMYEGGESFRAVAFHGVPPALATFLTKGTHRFGPPFFRPEGPWRVGQIADVRDAEPYRRGEEIWIESERFGHIRSLLNVPLVRGGRLLGSISIYRRDVQPFTDKQIALVRTFADQAVIAIENVRLFNETKEALERQTATAEILKVIARSPSDVQPVFDAIAASAQRLTGAVGATLYEYDGQLVHLRAQSAPSYSHADRFRALFPRPLAPDYAAGRVIMERRILHVGDLLTDPGTPPATREWAAWLGIKGVLWVPLLREGEPVGVIGVVRAEAGRFSDDQVKLLETFAAQAVIAIENARLFNETREALEHQTATAELLQVISGSIADTSPVFNKILASCRNLFGNSSVQLGLLGDDGMIHLHQDPELFVHPDEQVRRATEAVRAAHPRPSRDSIYGYVAYKRSVIHYPDVQDGPDVPAGLRDSVKLVGFNYSALYAPLLWEGRGIGALSVLRVPPAPFSDKEIRLLKTFADQAVIAIQNARLFNETKEALERQTATAEILKVIASSPSDVRPVFDAIAASAMRLTGSHNATVTRVEGDMLHLAAHTSVTPEADEALRQMYPHPISGYELTAQMMQTLAPIQIVDAELDEQIRSYARTRGWRSLLITPLVREGRCIGTINISRKEPGPFSEHQVSVIQTFADQAVIAIENVRLFNETKEALERQTATAEILKVISESPTDVQPVFDAIVQSAARLFGCNAAIQMLEDGGLYLNAYAGPGVDQVIERTRRLYPMPFEPERSRVSRALQEGRVLEVPDIDAPGVPSSVAAVGRAAGFQAAVNAPLLRGGVVLGMLSLTWHERGHKLDDQQLGLLKTFADQTVIALENTRLFNETKEALERQTATAEILKVISASPTDVQPVFDAIAESAARLFGGRSAILIVEGKSVDLKAAAIVGVEPGLLEARFREMKKAYPAPLDPKTSAANRSIATCEIVEIADSEAPGVPEVTREVCRAAAVRSFTVVPLVRAGEGIGSISIAFEKPGVRLNDKQRVLLQTFADQAVIAIENVRLFNELKERTDALTKSVGQLTALGEVSQAISSTLDLDKVLQTIVSRAVQLTGLDAGAIYEYDEERQVFNLRGGENVPEEIVELNRSEPVRIGEGAIGRAAVTRQPVQVADLAAGRRQTRGRDVLLQIGARALLAVPLLSEGHILGALTVTRHSPGEFPADVIALLETFAAQSAIAIQNARLFREIEQKGRELEIASQHKSQFLASMSHELRTPLNAILGFNEMILGEVYGEVSEDMRPPLAQMQSSGRHLLRLINNVLDLAKIEANKMELSRSDYAVQDILAMVHSTLQALAAEKGLEFAVSAPDELPLAYGDGGRLSQCLINLAGNAIKFTRQGRVEIRAALEGDTLSFSVADTGIGIPADKIDGLFTEFKQTDAAIASEYGGTGLGLAITKKFIEMHGGRIWVESEPGKGSTFIFEVPLRVDAGATP
jgi:GAF domain-containing protein